MAELSDDGFDNSPDPHASELSTLLSTEMSFNLIMTNPLKSSFKQIKKKQILINVDPLVALQIFRYYTRRFEKPMPVAGETFLSFP